MPLESSAEGLKNALEPSLYYKAGWQVSHTVGNPGGFLGNQGDGEVPPETGWLYDRRTCPGRHCRLFNDDQSLRLSWGSISPVCRLVLLSAEGEDVKIAQSTIFFYGDKLELQPFKWSEGRPIYQKPNVLEYLMVAEGQTTWSVFKTHWSPFSSPTIQDMMSKPPKASSGRATLSPVDKEAGPSARLGVSNWR